MLAALLMETSHDGSAWVSSMPATLLSALRRLPNIAIPSAVALDLTA
jgi:hypothetical protein